MTSTTTSRFEETDVSKVWQQLSEQLDAFVAAWQSADEPPALADFLPRTSGAVRRLTLVEAVKVDLEYRWQGQKSPKLVEDYVREFPELDSEGGIPCDVIYEEYHIRKRCGPVSAAEYFERFPARADELKRLFDLEKPELTATLVRTERCEPVAVGDTLDDFDLLSSPAKARSPPCF